MSGEHPETCPVCTGPMPPPNKTGRPFKQCSPKCRKTAWRRRNGQKPWDERYPKAG